MRYIFRISRAAVVTSGLFLAFIFLRILISLATWWPCERLSVQDSCLDSHLPECSKYLIDGVHYDFSTINPCWILIIPSVVLFFGLFFEVFKYIQRRKLKSLN